MEVPALGEVTELLLAWRRDDEGAKQADIVRLYDVLEALGRIDRSRSNEIDPRFFSGLTLEETSEVLTIRRDTVLRNWRLARAVWRGELRASHG